MSGQVQPSVLLLRDKYITARANAITDRKTPERVPLVSIVDVLSKPYATDAHYFACSAAVPHRLASDDLSPGDAGVRMELAVFDVDDPVNHPLKIPAREEWRADERCKVMELFHDQDVGVAYDTTHGYRLVFRLTRPFLIIDESDAVAWTKLYKAYCRYLKRRWDIEADTSCAQWTRLYRAPRATRDPKLGPEQREMMGHPPTMGVWSC